MLLYDFQIVNTQVQSFSTGCNHLLYMNYVKYIFSCVLVRERRLVDQCGHHLLPSPLLVESSLLPVVTTKEKTVLHDQ